MTEQLISILFKILVRFNYYTAIGIFNKTWFYINVHYTWSYTHIFTTAFIVQLYDSGVTNIFFTGANIDVDIDFDAYLKQ